MRGEVGKAVNLSRKVVGSGCKKVFFCYVDVIQDLDA